MAEGLLGGILGEDDEKPEVEAPETLSSADAFAAAVAAKLAGNDPGVARKTEIFLDKHAQLLDIQAAHLQSEHASRLHFLQGQAREVDIRRLGLKLRIGFQLFLALLASAVAIGLVIMFRDAVTSRSVVIEPIDVATNLAAQVPNGRILAAGLLDVLNKIQASNHSGAERRALSNGWTSEIAIEVPETGVSLGQIERTLKTRFGHDQHIDADLVQIDRGGLALTVRGTGILAKTFTDEARNLDKLLLQAGEYVYGQSQPGLWTSYLANNGRGDDAINFAKAAYGTVDPGERVYVLNYWANAIVAKGDDGAMSEALPLYRETVRLKPDYYTGYNNIIFALIGLGDEEDAVRVGERLKQAAGGRPGRAPEEMYQNYDQVVWDLPAQRAEDVAEMQSHNGIGTTGTGSGAENLQVAQLEMQMHDLDSATFRLKTTVVDPDSAADLGQVAMDRALIAEETGDFGGAVKEWDVLARTYAASAEFSTNNRPTICFAAVAYEKAGQPAKADAALDAVGKLNLVDCFRFRGDVLDLRGDWSGAQSWYAKAVKLGPSVPSGYYSWGMALVRHGDVAGASAKFEQAHQRGPHWADPLRAWGDLLMKQKKIREARARYEEALMYAPNWKQLRSALSVATSQRG
jgi:tetratricopeptide (TPR) repeat protein